MAVNLGDWVSAFPDRVLEGGFSARHDGVRVEVVTVLDRTAVVVAEGKERQLVRLDQLVADEADFKWHERKTTWRAPKPPKASS